MEPNEASPVVRLLDFTANLGSVRGGIADSSRNFQIPEHAQTQFQSSLMALAQVRACESSRSQVRSRTVAVLNNPAMQNTRPSKRERISSEQNDATPKKKKHCNCKHSRCLKLYCECFLAQVYCDGCNCTNCFNKEEHEDERNESITSILERNPQAFLPKIAKSPSGTANGVGVQVEHKKGCKCKKSNCLKRYCECFQANVFCSDKCNCVGCKNSEESEERKSLFSERPSNTIMMQRAANAAINVALETTNKDSRNQENHRISDASCSLPSFHVMGPPRTYRSPLSGILQVQHVNDFGTLLVELSTKAASTLTEAKKMNCAGMDIDMNEPRVPVASPHEEDGVEDHRKHCNAMDSCEHQEKKKTDDSNMSRYAPPLSPGTLALMCNERDTDLSTSDTHESNTMELTNTTSENGFDKIYIEQERLVLTTFRSFLNRLITCGSIEESKAELETS